jgi:hypothetical protein
MGAHPSPPPTFIQHIQDSDEIFCTVLAVHYDICGLNQKTLQFSHFVILNLICPEVPGDVVHS